MDKNEGVLNKSGNLNLNLSSNVYNDHNHKHFLMTSVDNLSSKFKDKQSTLLQNRINTPVNYISSSDKLLKDSFYNKTTSALQHKKSEQFSNKNGGLMSLRNVNELAVCYYLMLSVAKIIVRKRLL